MPRSVVVLFMLVMATGLVGIWTFDIRRGHGFVARDGLLSARDADNGSLMVPHWLAEYGTAVALVLGAMGLLLTWDAREVLAAAGLGALAYTALNSQAWVLADRERLPYGIPMVVGLVGALASLAWLIVG